MGRFFPPHYLMIMHIKISTTLRKYVSAYDPEKGLELDFTSGSTAREIADSLAIPVEEIKFVMVNGRCTELDAPLALNDRVAFFPAVGGG